jgi:hypothetical protein
MNDTAVQPIVPGQSARRLLRWAIGEVLDHPGRMSMIMVLAWVTFISAFAAGITPSLDAPVKPHHAPSGVRLMPHPSSPVARRTVRTPPVRHVAEPVPARTTTARSSAPAVRTAAPPAAPPVEPTTEPSTDAPVEPEPTGTPPTGDPPQSPPPAETPPSVAPPTEEG